MSSFVVIIPSFVASDVDPSFETTTLTVTGPIKYFFPIIFFQAYVFNLARIIFVVRSTLA